MSARIEEMIDDILKREGSAYTDHPKDRGGPTRYGVNCLAAREALAGSA